MSRERKLRRDRRQAAARPSAGDRFAAAVMREVSPERALLDRLDALGGRLLDADGDEAEAYFWGEHAKLSATFHSPRVAEMLAGGEIRGDKVAAIRNQLALAEEWVRAGRVDLGTIQLDLILMGGDPRAIAHAALEIALIRGESRKRGTA